MAESIERAKTLEERITSRIHEQIGDLMTDEDLRGIVARGVEKALFTERQLEVEGFYGGRAKVKPPLVVEIVEKVLGEKMREAVDAHFRAHPEQLQEAVDRAIARGIGGALLETLDQRFGEAFANGVRNLQGQGFLPGPPF